MIYLVIFVQSLIAAVSRVPATIGLLTA